EALAGSSDGNAVKASPRWGVEPGNGHWPAAGDFLVYGYPTAGTDASNGFELGTIPAGTINAGTTATNPINVGICSATTIVVNGQPSAANLLVHNGNEILPLVKLGFCSQSASADVSRSWFASLTSKMTSLFSPSLAYAQDAGDLFIGGLPSGWSPFKKQTFQAADVALSYTEQPVDTKVSSTIEVKVSASAAANTTLPPQNIVLTIFGNHGTPSFINDN